MPREEGVLYARSAGWEGHAHATAPMLGAIASVERPTRLQRSTHPFLPWRTSCSVSTRRCVTHPLRPAESQQYMTIRAGEMYPWDRPF